MPCRAKGLSHGPSGITYSHGYIARFRFRPILARWSGPFNHGLPSPPLAQRPKQRRPVACLPCPPYPAIWHSGNLGATRGPRLCQARTPKPGRPVTRLASAARGRRAGADRYATHRPAGMQLVASTELANRHPLKSGRDQPAAATGCTRSRAPDRSLRRPCA